MASTPMITITLTLVASLFIVCVTCTHNVEESVEDFIGPDETIYHLHAIKENVDRIKRSWRLPEPYPWTSHVQKRSIRKQQRKLGADDLILNSLSSYCKAFKADPEISEYLKQSANEQPLKFRDISGYSRYQPESESNSDLFRVRDPETIPIEILAQRDKESQKVWYVFSIAHSTTVHIARVDPFKFQKTTLEMPSDTCYDTVVSQARVSVDMSDNVSCRKNADEIATFQITDEGHNQDVITLYLDLCRFGQGSWTSEQVSDKQVAIPTFSISQSLSPNLQSIPYQSPSNTGGDNTDDAAGVDLGVPLNVHGYSFSIYLSLVNETRRTSAEIVSKTVTSYGVEKNVISAKFGGVEEVLSPETRLFNVRFLNSSTSWARIRIMLNNNLIQNRPVLLSLVYRSDNSPIVSYIQVDRKFPINTMVMPVDLPISFRSERRFFCDRHGRRQSDGRRVGGDNKNCTVRCEAVGRDISTIFITTPDTVQSHHVKSAALVLPGHAIAEIDLGPMSDEIRGDYQCTVVNGRGKITSREMTLYTASFVNVLSFYVMGADDDVFRAVCHVGGSNEKLQVAISLSEDHDNKVRLDNVEGSFLDNNVTFDQERNMTTLSILLSWQNVKAPRNLLHCDATGELGHASWVRTVKYLPKNYEGVYPVINRSLSKAEYVKRNSSYVFTCTAKGELPMHVDMGRRKNSEALEVFPSTLETREIIGNNTVVYTYSVRFEHLVMFPSIVCRVNNKYHHDWYTINYYQLKTKDLDYMFASSFLQE